MKEPGDLVKMGAQLSSFVGGHAASLHLQGSGGASWTVTADDCADNREALCRVLTAALCWLDGAGQFVQPALSGEVAMSPKPKQRN